MIGGIALLAILAGLFYASYSIRAGVYIKALCMAKDTGKKVALTFDDGPHPMRTPQVLDILKRHGIRAAFFVTGERAEAHPELIGRMIAEGHIVGNHTYSHKGSFPLAGAGEMAGELRRCDEAIAAVTGERPRFFRPPFGVTNPNVAKAVKAGGYTVAGWSIRSLDTVQSRPREKVAKRVARRLRPGAVILLHDDRERSGDLLEMIISEIEQRGYGTERMDILFGTE